MVSVLKTANEMKLFHWGRGSS